VNAINLGEFELGAEGHPQPVPEQPPPPSLRRWLPAGVVVLLLVALTGSGPPIPSTLSLLWTTVAGEQAAVAVAEQAMYVAAPADQGWTLTAYRLADGDRLWQRRLDHQGEWVDLQVAGEVPLVVTPDPVTDERTTAYDAQTGRQRWRQPGWPQQTVDGGRVLVARSLPLSADDGLQPYHLLAINVETGRRAWTIRVTTGEQVMHGPSYLVTLQRSGLLTRYDLTTGAPVVATEVDVSAGDLYPVRFEEVLPNEVFIAVRELLFVGGWSYPSVADELVVLPDPRDRTVSAYDATTLERRWRAPGLIAATPCGPVICGVTEGWSGVVGLDRATGRLRWSQHCPGTDSCYVLPRGVAAGGPVLLERWHAASRGRTPVVTSSEAWLVEPATGEMVGDLGGWRRFPETAASEWLFGWRDWLARLSVDPVGLEVLGSMDADRCEPRRAYLICWAGERTEVWRIRQG
jgi:outer membrane protein assembly factor BamB